MSFKYEPASVTTTQLFMYSSQCKNNHLAEMWSGSEESSYLRLIDFCIIQL